MGGDRASGSAGPKHRPVRPREVDASSNSLLPCPSQETLGRVLCVSGEGRLAGLLSHEAPRQRVAPLDMDSEGHYGYWCQATDSPVVPRPGEHLAHMRPSLRVLGELAVLTWSLDVTTGTSDGSD